MHCKTILSSTKSFDQVWTRTWIESQLFVYLLQSASSDLSSQSSWSSQTHESGIHSPLCDLQVHSSEPQGLPTNERMRRKLVKKTIWVVYSKSLVFGLRCDSYWDLEWFCQVVFSLFIVKNKLIWKHFIDGAFFTSITKWIITGLFSTQIINFSAF